MFEGSNVLFCYCNEFLHYYTQSFVCYLKMLLTRKRNKITKHYIKALKDLKKGMSNEDAAAKYFVPKNTFSTWVKKKEKLLNSLEKVKEY